MYPTIRPLVIAILGLTAAAAALAARGEPGGDPAEPASAAANSSVDSAADSAADSAVDSAADSAAATNPAAAEPPAVRREAAAGPLDWQPADPVRFVVRPGTIWILTPETAVTGWAVGGGDRREIRQTRIRIERDSPRGPELLAVAQHLANTEVGLLRPDDPRWTSPPTAVDDPERPWPSPAILGFYETREPLDLNGNDRNEVVLTRMAGIADPGSRGLLLLEPGDDEAPRFVAPDELVDVIRFEDGYLTEIHPRPHQRLPFLVGDLPSLFRCRFLAQLGIRGGIPCDNCCLLPIVLAPDPDGRYRPIYERRVQQGFLDRLRGDLEVIVGGDPESPLSSAEKAALARAAAFFYLTGGVPDARGQLEKALGARSGTVEGRLFLDRVERYFLKEAPPRAAEGRTAEPSDAGSDPPRSGRGEEIGVPGTPAHDR